MQIIEKLTLKISHYMKSFSPFTFSNAVLLGKEHHNEQEFLDDFLTLAWFTYRSGYPAAESGSYTSDKGWGCMLRSGQMLLANTLLKQHYGREWRITSLTNDNMKEYACIMAKFIDSLTSPYSIQHIALEGKHFDLPVGSWFGPNTISQIINRLCVELTVSVPIDSIVYISEIRSEFQKSGKGTLLLINLLLGIGKINPVYYESIFALFKLNSCMGIAGGRPNSSLYFVGYQDQKIIYLDPHCLQQSLQLLIIGVPLRDELSYTLSDLQSYHCKQVKWMHIGDVDPSMVVGFYFATVQEFDQFLINGKQV